MGNGFVSVTPFCWHWFVSKVKCQREIVDFLFQNLCFVSKLILSNETKDQVWRNNTGYMGDRCLGSFILYFYEAVSVIDFLINWYLAHIEIDFSIRKSILESKTTFVKFRKISIFWYPKIDFRSLKCSRMIPGTK